MRKFLNPTATCAPLSFANLPAVIAEIEAGSALRVTIAPAAYCDEAFQLYTRYQTAVHHDDPAKLTKEAYTRFLVDSPLVQTPFPSRVADASLAPSSQVAGLAEGVGGYGSYHQLYYHKDVLVAVAVLDILPSCVSSV